MFDFLKSRRSRPLPRPTAVDNPRLHPLQVRYAPQLATAGSPSANAAAAPTPVWTLIQPPQRWPGFGFGEFWRLRAIALVLARRSLMVRYRETIVGVAWVLIQPISLMAVFSFFFGVVLKRTSGAIPFPVYVFSGLVMWMMIARVLTQGSTSITANAGLLTKIYFPRAYLPIGVAMSSVVDFGFGLIALLVLMVIFAIVPTIWILTLPLMAAMALAAGLGVTFWLAALNAQYRDIEQLLPFLTQVWFFATPIVYESDLFPPNIQPIFWLNPVAVAVNGFRWALTGSGSPPPLAAWAVGSLVATLLLVTGYMFFRSREPIMTDLTA